MLFSTKLRNESTEHVS